MKLVNGRIHPGTGFASEVAIDGNRIADDAAGPVIDLRGRLVVPGFIDNHTHFIDGGLQLTRVQLRDAGSAAEIAERIAAHARTLRPDGWVTGGSWDVAPDRASIDAVTPDTPVFVTRLDMHMGVANAVALRLAGISRDTPDPPGGTIVRDAHGEPTGLLKDAAMQAIRAVIPPPSDDERAAAGRAALREAARAGVTSLCDMSWEDTALDDFRAYRRLEDAAELTARVHLFTPIKARERLRYRSDRLRTNALKGFSDGSLGSSTAAMFEPFDDDPRNRGLMMKEMQDGSMARWVAEAVAAGVHVALHAIGDRANDAVLSLFESFPGSRAHRFRVEHAQHLSADLVPRFARAGVIASMQPYHAVEDGRWAHTKISGERARWMYPFRALLDAGAIVTFGSDWTVAPLDPLAGIRAAVDRGVTPDEALRCYTANNAYAIFAEHEVGRIAPGMFADLVVLSGPDVERSVVDMTIVDGQVVYER